MGGQHSTGTPPKVVMPDFTDNLLLKNHLREEEIKDREGGSSLQHSISMQHQALNLQKLCCRDIPASLMATLLPVTVATADEA